MTPVIQAALRGVWAGCSCDASAVAAVSRSCTTSSWFRPTSWSTTAAVSRVPRAVIASRRGRALRSRTTVTSTVRPTSTSSSASSGGTPAACRHATTTTTCRLLATCRRRRLRAADETRPRRHDRRCRAESTRLGPVGRKCRGRSWNRPFTVRLILSRQTQVQKETT